MRQCTAGNGFSLCTKHYVILLQCNFKVYVYDEHFMQFHPKYFKTIFFMKKYYLVNFL